MLKYKHFQYKTTLAPKSTEKVVQRHLFTKKSTD